MASSAGEIAVDGKEVMASIRVHVRLSRIFGIRMWVATRLFELAGWVSRTTVWVEVDDE